MYKKPCRVCNLKKINDLRTFPENWNGYGGSVFSVSLCDYVSELLKAIPNDMQPSVYPTGRCSVQFEYHKLNGDYLEFEVYENKRIESFSVIRAVEREHTVSNADELVYCIKQFINHIS